MNETKIKAWDEVHGVIEEEKTSTVSDIEAAGAGPSISKNYLRGVEDMVEQNDNSFDGIINNLPKQEDISEKSEGARESVLKKLKDCVKILGTSLPLRQCRISFHPQGRSAFKECEIS